MKVHELISLLKLYDPDLPIVHGMFSEFLLLDPDSIRIEEHCEPRNDGWVHRDRPDKPKIRYLVFPGN